MLFEIGLLGFAHDCFERDPWTARILDRRTVRLPFWPTGRVLPACSHAAVSDSGLPHHAHAALAELLDEPVVREHLSGLEGYGILYIGGSQGVCRGGGGSGVVGVG